MSAAPANGPARVLKTLLSFAVAVVFAGCATPSGEISEAPPATPERQVEKRAGSLKPPLVKIRERAQAPDLGIDAVSDDDVWTLISGNLGFANTIAEQRVLPQIDRYAHNQEYFDRTLKRAQLYLPYVLERVLEDNLPAEIALLPFVESAYNPFAHSHSGAVGLWQFIPATGDHLELERNDWYDGRRDVIHSTTAAIAYLGNLYEQFDGDWLLTLAAYNAGPGTIRRAIAENEKQGKPVDFWSLDLHRETSRYVPRLIALTKVISDPQRFGVELAPIATASNFAVLDLEGPVDLSQAAGLANVSTDRLYKLNPGYSKWVTPPEGPYHLVLPGDDSAALKAKLEALPTRQWRPLDTYTVVRGDTLSSVATRHHVSTAQLAALNDMKIGDILRIGQSLRLPAAMNTDFSAGRRILTTYTVKSGDSLWEIANSYGLSVDQLCSWNALSPETTLQPGQTLQLAANGFRTRHPYRRVQ